MSANYFWEHVHHLLFPTKIKQKIVRVIYRLLQFLGKKEQRKHYA